MANKAYFIDVPKMQENTPLSLNVEAKLISSSIWDAQEIHIQPILGSELYKKMKADVWAKTITGNYKTLLDDYVIPALIQWTLSECLVFIRFKIVNKSVSEQSSDNSVPVATDDLKFLMAEIRNKAEFYTQRLSDHIVANSSLYPEYSQNTTLDDLQPSTNAYFSGIHLDDEYPCERLMGYNKNNTSLI